MMKNKKPLLFIGGVLLTIGISNGVTNVFAQQIQTDLQPKVEEIQIEKSEEVLAKAETLNTEAETLNNDIQMEIERIREERRLEEERIEQNLVDFISNAKNHRFVNFDIRTQTGLTGAQLDKALEGTGLEGLGQYYAKAEKEYGVSSIALVGISALESSWGNSKFARERNNLFGYQAYDSNVNAAKHFSSKEEAIMTVANHLSQNYLTEGAMYHNGYTLESVNIMYASDMGWSQKITGIMNRIVEGL